MKKPFVLLAVLCALTLVTLGLATANLHHRTLPSLTTGVAGVARLASLPRTAGDVADFHESLLAPPEHPKLYSRWCPVGLEAVLKDGLQRHGFRVPLGSGCGGTLNDHPA